MSIMPRHKPWVADYKAGETMYGPAATGDMMPSTLGTGVALSAGSPSLILPPEPTVTIPADEFKDLVGAIVALVQGTTTINEKIDKLAQQVEDLRKEESKRAMVSSILRTGRVSPAVAPPPEPINIGTPDPTTDTMKRLAMAEALNDWIRNAGQSEKVGV